MLHCNSMKEREVSLENLRKTLFDGNLKNIRVADVVTVTAKDPGTISADEIQKVVNYVHVTEPNVAFMNQFIKNIHINQLSLTLKHFEALTSIAQLDNDWMGLVLEDDMLFTEKVCQLLDDVAAEFMTNSAGFPMIYLSLPSEPDKSSVISKVDRSKYPLIPLVEAYFITPQTAKRILQDAYPIRFTHNLQINYILLKNNIDVFQSTNNIFVNGSRYGMFISSQNANNTLVFNKEYMTLMDINNKNEISETERTVAEGIISQSTIAKHPDFQYQAARFYCKTGDLQKAAKCFEDAYHTLSNSNTILNHESNMLKDFIRLHRDLQTS